MANRGPNTNGSQFFVTLRACPHLNGKIPLQSVEFTTHGTSGKHVVFGRVVRGYDIIQRIVEVPVDEKDRPKLPVAVANCGELVLRRQISEAPSRGEYLVACVAEAYASLIEKSQAKSAPENESASDGSERESRKRKHKKHRHRKHSSSESSGEDGDDEERHHHKRKRSKHKKHRSDFRKREGSEERKAEPEEETDEQYDTRLEREERERIEAEKRRELERLKRIAEAEVPTKSGVRFKGEQRAPSA